jgi:type I restriction enzyme S subunit
VRWPIVSLGEVCSLLNGRAFREELWSKTGLPIIRIQNLNGRGANFNYWDGSLDSQVLVKSGDLLLAWSGTPGTSFGAHIWTGPQGVLNQHIFRVDLNSSRIHSRWALRAINNQLNNLIDQAHGGVGLKHVTRGMVEGLQIGLPPLEEQRRIAAILDKADALRQKRRLALQKLDALTQSIFLDMFGDEQATQKWPSRHLCDVAEFKTGFPFLSSEYCETAGGDVVRLCRGANVLPARIDWSDLACLPNRRIAEFAEFKLLANDIVIAMDRPWISEGFKIAKVSDADAGALLVQRVARVRATDGVSPTFLYEMLRGSSFSIHSRPTETTVPHISPTDFRSFTFRVPPKNLQMRFEVACKSIDVLKREHSQSLIAASGLFDSIQHRAFRGEL